MVDSPRWMAVAGFAAPSARLLPTRQATSPPPLFALFCSGVVPVIE